MTADVTKTPFSIDYTGRDYYVLREQLIARVKDRVPDWTGNSSSDFGLALIESFAYMGDLLNYYIDRVANESYILTATQRDTLLNLSKMYGYSPANYTSAIVDIDFTNNNGYKKRTGAQIIESGVINGVTIKNIAKIIVPNDHPFTVDGPYDTIIVEGLTPKVPGVVGGVEVDYAATVYSGTFKVIETGYENIGLNVVWYRPSATITSIVPNGAEATVTYTGSLTAEVGQKVVISGVTSTGDGYNGNWYIKSVTPGEGSTLSSFVFNSEAIPAKITRVIGNGTTVTYSTFDHVTTNLNGYKTPSWNNFIVGQKVKVTGVVSSVNTGGTANTGYNVNTASVVAVTDISAFVTNVATQVGSNDVTFTASQEFTTGQIISIRNIKSTSNLEGTRGVGYNVSNAVVTATSTETATISNVVGNGTGLVTFTTTSSHGFLKDQYVTISDVVSTDTVEGVLVDTSVYNMSSAKIKSVPNSTSFTIEAFWSDTFKTGGTATLHKFTISQSGLTADPPVTTGIIGGAFCRQFTINKTTTETYTSGGSAVVLIGGTPTLTNAEVAYAELPAIPDTSGFVRNVGTTTVPAGSQISTQVNSGEGVRTVVFSTLNDINVPFGGISVAMVKQGEQVSTRAENRKNTSILGYDIDGEVIGIASSNNTANQSFPLKESIVDNNSIKVFVDRGVAYEEWTKVSHIMDYGPSDTVFEVNVSSTNQINVVFGDGISGEIPPPEATIKAQYLAGGGLIGNVESDTLTTWGKINETDENSIAIRNIAVTNQLAATGGGDPESNDSIRYNAPRALRTLNRAVTLRDFEDLSLSVERVAKAHAVATNRGSVTVFIAPFDDGTDEKPGYTGSELNTTWEYIKSGVEDFLSDKRQIGTNVTVSPPIYTYLETSISFTPLPQYSSSVVQNNIKKMIVNEFGYENMQFNDAITPEELEFKLRQVEGVQNAKAISLHISGGEGRNTVIGEVNEIFLFAEGGITLIPASTDATLTAFTITPYVNTTPTGSAIWAPVFKSNLLSYRVTVPQATTKIVVVAQPNDTNNNDNSGVAEVTINGKAVGTTPWSIEIPTPDTTIAARKEVVITVTAADGATVNTYKATVVKV
jgi:hypothetical protein